MIHVEDWAEIRRMHRVRHLGISRNTVLRALASDRPPQYRRAPKGSAVDAVEPAVRELRLKRLRCMAPQCGLTTLSPCRRSCRSGPQPVAWSSPTRSFHNRSSQRRPSDAPTRSRATVHAVPARQHVYEPTDFRPGQLCPAIHVSGDRYRYRELSDRRRELADVEGVVEGGEWAPGPVVGRQG